MRDIRHKKIVSESNVCRALIHDTAVPSGKQYCICGTVLMECIYVGFKPVYQRAAERNDTAAVVFGVHDT